MASLVELVGVGKGYGSATAVHPLSLRIAEGEFVSILGPSGCGKTTLLRMIGGFVTPDAGSILIDGRDVTRKPPEKRATNMVFQGYGLFPHMTVAQNVAYGLRIARVARTERARRVAEALDLIRLADLGDRAVSALSGGQRQRVALARALVMRPRVLLLDEPLSALDLKLRLAMQEEFRRIHAQVGGTFIFVTHDQAEAMSLASRICVMEAGRIVQDGTPEDIYRRPASRFVAGFIGEANLFEGVGSDERVRLSCGTVIPGAGAEGPIVCVVRPEAVTLAADPAALPDQCDARLFATVEDVVFLGPEVRTTLRTDSGAQALALSRTAGPLRPGDRVTMGWAAADQQVIAA